MKWHRHSLFAVRTQRSAIVLPCRAFEVRRRRADRGGPDGVDSQVREVKTGVLLVPSERVETSPGRHSLVRRFLVSCLGDANAIFARLYGQLRELGWLDTAHTVVVIVGDGAEWIWNRAQMFMRRCEDVRSWIATMSGDVRALKAALLKLLAYSSLTGEPIDLEMAQQLIWWPPRRPFRFL